MPAIGAGADAVPLPLATRGTALNPDFGGAESIDLEALAASGVWMTLIPEATLRVVAGAESISVTASRLAVGEVLFVSDAATCPADLTGDEVVGFEDVLAVLAVWGEQPGGAADVDGDGVVGFGDVLAVLTAWGVCP